MGEHVDKDMIAVRIAPDLDIAMVGLPAYFAERPSPTVPQDMAGHRCIDLRLSASREHFVWDFRKDGRELEVRADGPLAFNTIELIEKAALDVFGLGFLPGDKVRDTAAWLACWPIGSPAIPATNPTIPRRQPTPAFALLGEALRYRP